MITTNELPRCHSESAVMLSYSAEQAVSSQQDQLSLKSVVIEIDGDVVNLEEPKNSGQTTRQPGQLKPKVCHVV